MRCRGISQRWGWGRPSAEAVEPPQVVNDILSDSLGTAGRLGRGNPAPIQHRLTRAHRNPSTAYCLERDSSHPRAWIAIPVPSRLRSPSPSRSRIALRRRPSVPVDSEWISFTTRGVSTASAGRIARRDRGCPTAPPAAPAPPANGLSDANDDAPRKAARDGQPRLHRLRPSLRLIHHHLSKLRRLRNGAAYHLEQGQAVGAHGFVLGHHHDFDEETVEHRGEIGDVAQATLVVSRGGSRLNVSA